MVAPRPPAAGDAHVHEHVLDNGLRVLIQEVRTAPLVSVWCWYRVGSGDEAAGRTGVSHWVEHMNFKGTANIPPDQVKGIIERYGGYWNGYTWIDQTAYTETATRDALDTMLFIESERMARCLYEPAACESERTVIISELEGGENDPDELLERDLAAAALEVHPYRNPTIGWLPDLKAMTRDDLYAHYRRFYVPNNATLVVVGDVTVAEVLRGAERHFGPIAEGPAVTRTSTVEPPQHAERRVVVRREGTTGYVKLGYHAPAVDDPEFFPLLVADAVLTGAKGLSLWASFNMPPPQRSARLYRALVDGGLASSADGELMPTRQPFLYTLSFAATGDTALDRLEAVALEEIGRLASRGPTPEEVRRAQNQLRARLVFEGDRVANIAHQLGFFQTIASWKLFPSLAARVDAVTVETVAAAAARRLRAENRTVGWFEPLPPGTPARPRGSA